MSKSLLVFSLLFFGWGQFSAFSQTTDTLFLKGQFNQFDVDNLGTLYTVSKQDTLWKHTSDKTKQEYNYSNASLGDITAIDLSDPMQLVVCHGELSTLVLLDVTLRETARIYLPDLGVYSNPIAFAQLSDGTTWIYDDGNAQLLRVNAASEVVNKIQFIIQQVGFVPTISSMQANNQFLVMHDRQNGFLLFDQFGEYIKTLPIKGTNQYQLVGDRLVYFEDNHLQSYPLNGIGVKTLKTLPESATQFALSQKALFYLTEQGIWKAVVKESLRH